MDHVAVRPAGCTHPGECQRFGPGVAVKNRRWPGCSGCTPAAPSSRRSRGDEPRPATYTPPVFELDPERITASGYDSRGSREPEGRHEPLSGVTPAQGFRFFRLLIRLARKVVLTGRLSATKTGLSATKKAKSATTSTLRSGFLCGFVALVSLRALFYY